MHHTPDLNPFRKRLAELEKELAVPDVFKDQRRAATLSREHRRVEQLLGLGDEIETSEKTLTENRLLLDDEELGEMAAEEI